MEHIIFLHADEEDEATLSQIQHSQAQRLVLVIPTQINRLRASILLRLARRYTNAHKQLSVASEDRLIRQLAERMGYNVAATLDLYHGLEPGCISPSVQCFQQLHALPASTLSRMAGHATAPSGPLWREGTQRGVVSSPATFAEDRHKSEGEEIGSLSEQQKRPATATPLVQPFQEDADKTGANLEAILVDGYLPNPAAMPGLEEEEEQAEQEEHERLHYEIADENHPSQAQQEAEEHEARIIATILKTSNFGLTNSGSPPPSDQAIQSESAPPPAKAKKDEIQGADTPPIPFAGDEDPLNTLESGPVQQLSPRSHPSTSAQVSSVDAAEVDTPIMLWEGGLRPMRTIDEMMHERGRAEIFDWFVKQATSRTSRRPANTDPASAALPRDGAQVIKEAGAGPASSMYSPIRSGVFKAILRRLEAAAGRLTLMVQVFKAPGPDNPAQLRPVKRLPWQHSAVVIALTLSLGMTCLGFSLIPSAQVRYHIQVLPYTENLAVEARAGASSRQQSTNTIAVAPAEVARFDGILTAQGTATGRHSASGGIANTLAFPTSQDVDQIASLLQKQLQVLGNKALRAQQQPGDVVGPVLSDEEIISSPPAGANLPEGATSFQVSVALHLRATLIRHQALFEAIQDKVGQDVKQKKPGMALELGEPLKLTILDIEPARAGEAKSGLLVRVQASGIIGPALMPEQARSAITEMTVTNAEDYLRNHPGITGVFITVEPKWLNRLPFFSARIRINVES
jgi:hypothetical protein